MSAGLPSRAVSLLPPVGPSLPIVSTSLPSGLYLKRALSMSALPLSQTKPFLSTYRPCSRPTHGLFEGPPQPWMKLPSASNSITDGAGAQQLLRGGFRVAPFSSSERERGRCSTQTWSFESTATLATWPKIQLLGKGLGQNGSTVNCGTGWAAAGKASIIRARIAQIVRLIVSLLVDVKRLVPSSASWFASRPGYPAHGSSSGPCPIRGPAPLR